MIYKLIYYSCSGWSLALSSMSIKQNYFSMFAPLSFQRYEDVSF